MHFHTKEYYDKKVRKLLLEVPGNLDCADCGKNGTANVKFCSVKLGVFLCNQCYAAHRALGAHITRCKCIGLDRFDHHDIEILSSRGNIRVNEEYEATMPEGVKPPPTPCSGCTVSTCQDCKERLNFISDKYQKGLWYSETPAARSNVTPTKLKSPRAKATATKNNDPFGLFTSSEENPSSPNRHRKNASLVGEEPFSKFIDLDSLGLG